MKIINHIRRWLIWRKSNCNSGFHKFLVLIGFIKSPTFKYIDTRGFKGEFIMDEFIMPHQNGKWVERENDNAVEVLTKQR